MSRTRAAALLQRRCVAELWWRRSGKVTFTKLPDGFGPLERVVLTANGNLQRIIRYAPYLAGAHMSFPHAANASAYYNAPVAVHVIRSEPSGQPPTQPCERVFEREIDLICLGQVRALASAPRAARSCVRHRVFVAL